MGAVLISISFLLYVGISIDNLLKKDYQHSLIWFGYAVAQTGFIWYELTREKA